MVKTKSGRTGNSQRAVIKIIGLRELLQMDK